MDQNLTDDLPDMKTEDASLRDFACIKLKVPETNKDWLNELIVKSLRMELAGNIIQGFVTGFDALTHKETPDLKIARGILAIRSLRLADAILRESKREKFKETGE